MKLLLLRSFSFIEKYWQSYDLNSFAKGVS